MKKVLFICVILFFIAYSFFAPEIIVNAAKKGIELWFHQILPALLPFTILSAVLVKSDFLRTIKGNANLIACLLTLSCGFVFGFPIGAKLSADFYKQKLLSNRQATFLSIATNIFSPMYVCGFALPLLFTSKEYILVTYVLLYLTPLLITTSYLLLENRKKTIFSKSNPALKNDNFSFILDMKIMDSGIISGFESLIKICGYIVLFSIITEVLMTTIITFLTHPPLWLSIFLCNFEITNGINLLSQCNMQSYIVYILAIQLLSFGGLSGIAQAGAILSDAGLSMRKYIIGKAALSLLLTLLSVIYVFFIRLL